MILELSNVSKNYGALQVCSNISTHLQEGEALGILGPNGAGKTTLLSLVSGDVPASSGVMKFQGQDISKISAAKRCHMGIARTAQIPRPFTGMTVLENTLVAASYGRKKSEKESLEHCANILEKTGLFERWNVLAGELRLLDRKRLELSRALATEPKLLLLDEIAGGLTDHEVHALLDIITDIRKGGVSIIWIEHIVHALVKSVDRIMAINFGTKLIEGKPQEVIDSQAFKEVYFGVESVKLGAA
jgi:branched-chain amino acid transport system ATP-binding protein